MSPQRFRILLCTYLALVLTSAVVDFIPGVLPLSLEDALTDLPTPSLLEIPWLFMVVAIPSVLALLVGLVGLFLFKPWGRFLSTISTVGGFLLLPFLGPTVSSGIGSTLYEASAVLWGVVLACAYFSPISALFSSQGQTES